jgi:alpha-beta hydrolase superfamily lysophospholipase
MLDVILAAALQSRIPFTLVDNRIVIKASVNGRPGFAMILDTGTNGLALTPQAAARLKLSLRRGPSIGGAGAATVKSSLTQIGGLQLGTYAIGNAPALVLNLDTIRKLFHFPQLDGIVGYDMLHARFVGIDMGRRVVTVSSVPIKAPAAAHHAPFNIQGGLIVINGAINGVHGDMIVDTGDRSQFTVFQRFANANGFYNLAMRAHNVVTGYGIGGPIRADTFVSTLSVFGFDLPNVVTRAPLGNAGAFSTAPQMGSVGDGLLRRFNTIFDAQTRTITVWPSREIQVSDAPAAPMPPLPRHALFGAIIADGPQGPVASKILPGTAAATAGVLNGDVITALAGVPTPNTAAFLAQMHRLHAGERVDVSVLRGGATRRFSAVLGTPANEDTPSLTTDYRTIAVDGTLRRTLVTFPSNAPGKLPAMLLMGGIGCYSVDVASNAQDPYMRLAHAVSSAGFVTMRVEKSGVGDSEGPPCKSVDFAAEQRAYVAGLQALRRDPRVDGSRIYLFGHSIGSLEAPILANSQGAAGVIVAEAVGRDWPEYELRNVRRQLELAGRTAAEVDQALIGKQECLSRLLFEKEPEAFIEQSEPECKVHNGVYPVDPPYMQQVAAVNVIGQWARISVPVLAIYGGSDFVTEQPDHERIVAVVNAKHSSTATFVRIGNMDHFLSVEPTAKASYDASSSAPRQYNDRLSAVVVQWLCSRTSCALAPPK